MNILSILAFPAIGASHRSHAMGFVDQHPSASPRSRANERFELMSVVVASKDALQVRKALLGCPDAAVIRCLPIHKDDRAKLEIRFPAGQGDAVIGRILACLPHGEIGGIVACAGPHSRPRSIIPSNLFRVLEF